MKVPLRATTHAHKNRRKARMLPKELLQRELRQSTKLLNSVMCYRSSGVVCENVFRGELLKRATVLVDVKLLSAHNSLSS